MREINVNEIVGSVDLNDWKTKKEIMLELQINNLKIAERTWRKAVEEYNKGFWNHETDKFLAHSSKGYKLTADKDEIMASIKDGKKRSLNMLWKYSQTMKALGEKDNIRFDLEEMGLM